MKKAELLALNRQVTGRGASSDMLAEAGVRIFPVKRIDQERMTRSNLLGAEIGI